MERKKLPRNPREMQEEILGDEKFEETWKNIQMSFHPTKINTQDPILQECGQFEGQIIRDNWGYKKKRMKLYEKHWSDDGLDFKTRKDYKMKCLDFIRKHFNKAPATLFELCLGAIPFEQHQYIIEELPHFFKEIGRFRRCNTENTSSLGWQIVHLLQTQFSYPFVLGGSAAASLWMGSAQYSDIDLFTFIPMTDMNMWVESLKSHIFWFLFGLNWLRNDLRAFFISTKSPSLNLTTKQIKVKNVHCHPYGMNIRVAALLSFECQGGDKIDIVFLIDDAPAFKTHVKVPPGRGFIPCTGGYFLQDPVKYSKDGRGFKYKCDPTHMGIKQQRLAMIDFTCDELKKTLQNPYLLMSRVVETFDFEHCKFSGVFLCSGELMLVFLGQGDFITLSEKDKNQLCGSELPCKLRSKNGGLEDFSHCSKCLPFDCISVESLEELHHSIWHTCKRLLKYESKFDHVQREKINKISRLPLHYPFFKLCH